MNKYIFIALFLSSIFQVTAQPDFVYANVFGASGSSIYGEAPPFIAVDAEGNTVATAQFQGTVSFPGGGRISSQGDWDIYVKKNDSEGNFLWSFALQNSQEQVPRDIKVDAEGNIIVTGYFRGTMDFDPSSSVFNMTQYNGSGGITNRTGFVAKYSPDGNFLWSKRFGSTSWASYGESLALDNEDNIYVTGDGGNAFRFENMDLNFTASSLFVIKLNAEGDFQWFNHFHKVDDNAHEQITFAGNLYLVSSFTTPINLNLESSAPNVNPIGENDLLIVLINPSNGEFIRAGRIAGDHKESIINIISDEFDNKYVLYSSKDEDEAYPTYFVRKTNDREAQQFRIEIDSFIINDLAIGDKSQLYLVGNRQNSITYNPSSVRYEIEGDGTGVLLKFSDQGTFIKKSLLKTDFFSGAGHVACTDNNQVIVTGSLIGRSSLEPNVQTLDYSPIDVLDAYQFMWTDCEAICLQEKISGCAPQSFNGIDFYDEGIEIIDIIDENGCLTQVELTKEIFDIDPYILLDENGIECDLVGDYTWTEIPSGNILPEQTNILSVDEPGFYTVQIETPENCSFASRPIRYPENAFYPGFGTVDKYGQHVIVRDSFIFVSGESAASDNQYVFPMVFRNEEWISGSVIRDINEKSSNQEFKGSIDTEGNWMVAGNPNAGQGGEVYIYEKNAPAFRWNLRQTLRDQFSFAKEFGYAVSIHEGTIIVGAPGSDFQGHTAAGKIYTYRREGNEWIPNGSYAERGSYENRRYGQTIANTEHYTCIGSKTNLNPLSDNMVHIYPQITSGLADDRLHTIEGNNDITQLNQAINSDVSDALQILSNEGVISYAITDQEVTSENLTPDIPEGALGYSINEYGIAVSYYNAEYEAEDIHLYKEDGDGNIYEDVYNNYMPRDGFASGFDLLENNLLIGAPFKLNPGPRNITGKLYQYEFNKRLSSIEEHALENKFHIYPNPTHNFLTIDNQNELIQEIAIYNNLAHLVKVQKTESSEINVDLNGLDHGLYYIKLKTKSGQTFVKKCIKI